MIEAAVRETAVERDTEEEVATAALLQCQDFTWTMTGCIHGSVCPHIPALLPLTYVTRTLILTTIPTTCGLGMTLTIGCPHEIIHLPPGETLMAPRFEETPMIIILVLCHPQRVGDVHHPHHLQLREEAL